MVVIERTKLKKINRNHYVRVATDPLKINIDKKDMASGALKKLMSDIEEMKSDSTAGNVLVIELNKIPQ